jgi:hypothetical protein
MQGKVALEEHFALPETVQDSAGFVPGDYWVELKTRLLDMQDRRLREMDANGIEMMLPSLNAPAVQAIPDRKQAIEIARRANDFLAGEIAKRPDRFQGLAALPMQDPDAAARELGRCVRDLGFRGALVNGFSQVDDAADATYYDLPQYRPFWQRRNDWTCHFICTPAIRCPSTPTSTAVIPGCSVRPGPSRRRLRCTRFASWRRACSMFIQTCASSSAIWARVCPIRYGVSTTVTPGSKHPRLTRRSDLWANTFARISTSPRRVIFVLRL